MTEGDSAARLTQPAHLRLDLRAVTVEDVLGRVERSLDLRLERTAAVYKRRTVGMSTDRGTWIRLECRGPDRDTGQGWGLEAARIAHGVPAPHWFAGLSWFDEIRQVSWRADEIEYVADQPLKNAYAAEGLPDTWWTAMSDALEHLAACHTTRRATPDCEPITCERVRGAITRVFPSIAVLELEDWSPAHGDLVWSNLTGPTLKILTSRTLGSLLADWMRPVCGPDRSVSQHSPRKFSATFRPISSLLPAGS